MVLTKMHRGFFRKKGRLSDLLWKDEVKEV